MHVTTRARCSARYDKVGILKIEIQDLRRVVLRAQRLGGKVVVGGHSLGGSITAAYATWDFAGKAGARGLSGLVFIDGGSSPTPISADDARQRLSDLQAGSPWLTFGGIPAPFTGLFNSSGSLAVKLEPNAPPTGRRRACCRPTSCRRCG
jgi:pimeloyl-ACP methyl ester carboxylesterase